MCGEHPIKLKKRPLNFGSSPRVRGTWPAHTSLHNRLRLIPACAGNIEASSTCSIRSTAHPRVCGEHSRAVPIGLAVGGSSPRVRGTFGTPPMIKSATRLIPACAGNITDAEVAKKVAPAHPRVCGEHSHTSRPARESAGSSPRVRGTWCSVRLPSGKRRLIPACAGNIIAARAVLVDWSAHPRVCGEHLESSATAEAFSGSSPRVRGTSEELQPLTVRSRLIPACAGNIEAALKKANGCAAHPRVCGEHRQRLPPATATCGSSPRVRGTSLRQ